MTALTSEHLKKANSQLGYISIGLNSNRLRIRCRTQEIYINKTTHPATKDGLESCVALCKMIEADIYRQCFDASLVKYGLVPKREEANEPTKGFNLRDVWNTYKTVKGSTSAATVRTCWNPINEWMAECPDEYLLLGNTDKFLEWLKSKHKIGALPPKLRILNAAFNLCLKLDKIQSKNPFPVMMEAVKKGCPKKQVKSFSRDEMKAIIHAFRNGRFDSKYSAHSSKQYADLVEFRFLTGCRPSEAIALTWDDIKDDGNKCQIVFNKRYSSGELVQGTKNGSIERIFPCNKQLAELLGSMPRIPNEGNLVFPNNIGGYIDANNFSSRMWKPTVSKLVKLGEVKEYLPFYDQRHTFGTHVIRNSGYDLKTIVSIMGNSPQTLMKHYIAVNDDIELPEL